MNISTHTTFADQHPKRLSKEHHVPTLKFLQNSGFRGHGCGHLSGLQADVAELQLPDALESVLELPHRPVRPPPAGIFQSRVRVAAQIPA
jgi:hypothetical protein